MSAKTDYADEHLARWSDLFPDPDAREALVEAALVRMNGMMQRTERELRAIAQDGPLTYEEFRTLHALIGGVQRGKPSTPAELAERTGVSRAGMTSRLDRLTGAGMVTRTPDENDRRSVQITATKAGHKAWQQMLDAWAGAEQRLFAGLSERELQQLNTVLRKVVLTSAEQG